METWRAKWHQRTSAGTSSLSITSSRSMLYVSLYAVCLCLLSVFLSTFLRVCLSFPSVLSVSLSDHILQFHEDTHVFLLPTSPTGILSYPHIHSFIYSLFTTPLQLLENDIQAQQGRIDDIMAQVRRFREANHFQSDQIEDRGRELVAK